MHKTPPVLYIFSGLPGVGKSTLASALAKHIGATYLQVDVIEQALKDIYQSAIYDEGYQLAFRMAADSLRRGLTVVGDSCNTVKKSRNAWQQVAADTQFDFINIEVVCSDVEEHQSRIEGRLSTIANLQLPTWLDVMNREYQRWETDVVHINTAHHSPSHSIAQLITLLNL